MKRVWLKVNMTEKWVKWLKIFSLKSCHKCYHNEWTVTEKYLTDWTVNTTDWKEVDSDWKVIGSSFFGYSNDKRKWQHSTPLIGTCHFLRPDKYLITRLHSPGLVAIAGAQIRMSLCDKKAVTGGSRGGGEKGVSHLKPCEQCTCVCD